MVFFSADAEASICASSSGLRGEAGARRNANGADLSNSGKPLLYAVRCRRRKVG